jgi:hypothetical protein
MLGQDVLLGKNSGPAWDQKPNFCGVSASMLSESLRERKITVMTHETRIGPGLQPPAPQNHYAG